MNNGYRIHLQNPEQREHGLKLLLLAGFQYRTSEGLSNEYFILTKPYLYIYTDDRKFLTFGSGDGHFRTHDNTQLATIHDLEIMLRTNYNVGSLATHIDNEGFQWSIFGRVSKVFHPEENEWIETVIDSDLITLTPI